jgi:hypothetical protein
MARALEIWRDRGIPPPPGFLETDTAFATEGIDPSWSSAREAEILGEIGQMTGLQLVTVQVECRTSTCRLQLTYGVALPDGHPDVVAVHDPIFPELFTRLGYEDRPFVTAPEVISGDNHNTVTSLAYLPRERTAESAANR